MLEAFSKEQENGWRDELERIGGQDGIWSEGMCHPLRRNTLEDRLGTKARLPLGPLHKGLDIRTEAQVRRDLGRILTRLMRTPLFLFNAPYLPHSVGGGR